MRLLRNLKEDNKQSLAKHPTWFKPNEFAKEYLYCTKKLEIKGGLDSIAEQSATTLLPTSL